MVEITNALINEGPSAFRVEAGQVYEVVEDLVYQYGFGNAISNDAVGGSVLINGNGHSLINLPGGGPFNGTSAVGINILSMRVELHNLRIRDAGGLGKFNIGMTLPCFYTNGQPDYSTTPGGHWIEQCEFSGWVYGMQAMGNDIRLVQVYAGQCGGSSFSSKPIGLDVWGAAPIINNCYVQDMIKGPLDEETMHIHLADCNNGSIGTLTLANETRNPKSFGFWFNNSGRFNMNEGTIHGVEVVFGGDPPIGTLQGSAWDYKKLSVMGGKTVIKMVKP